MNTILYAFKKSISVLVATATEVSEKKKARKKISYLLKSKNEIFLEVGSGPSRNIPGWTGLDFIKEADISWDLKYGIPFPNETVSKIFSSHVFEHFSFEQGMYLLTECRRVLKPGGIFMITVPNAKLYIDSYSNPGQTDMRRHKNQFYLPGYNDTKSAIDIVNYMFYMNGEHKNMFDQESLVNFLTLGGFKGSTMRNKEPILDSVNREYESLYAIAYK